MDKIHQDFLKECMSDVGNAPLDEFNQYFCIKCQNIDCIRAGGNDSIFKKRISSWEDSLFKNVSRADDDDSRFNNIRSKKFLPIIKETKYEVISNTELPILDTSKMKQQIKINNKELDDDLTLVDMPKEVKIEPLEVKINEHIQNTEFSSDIQNTEFKQGTMLSKTETELTVKKPGSIFIFDDE